MTELPTSSSPPCTSDVVSQPPDARIRTVSIIGAGVMGRAIAACSVRSGHHVQIADAYPQAATDAVREILTSPTSGLIRGPHFAKSSSSAVIRVVTSDADLAAADLVIEAVPENLALKREVLSRIGRHLSRHTVVASNTSSIPISELAEALPTPGRFCGLHFCHPVAERALVEVIAAATTSTETKEQATAFAVALGKSPVVVRDGPGFVLNRILSPYLTESMELLLEGVDVQVLDQAAHDFGMPCGPLRHLDEFGIDVSLAVGATLLRAFPDRFIPSELLIAMYKSGRRGSKSGGGFYSTDGYPGDIRIAPAVRDIISQRSRKSHHMTTDEVSRRLFLPMFLEATRVLEERVVEIPDIIDQIVNDGLCMTSEYHGLFRWADALGVDTLLGCLEPFQPLGRRFEPTSLLVMVAANRAAS